MTKEELIEDLAKDMANKRWSNPDKYYLNYMDLATVAVEKFWPVLEAVRVLTEDS